MYLQPFVINFIDNIYMPLQSKVLILNNNINCQMNYASFYGSFCLTCNHYAFNKNCGNCGKPKDRFLNSFNLGKHIITPVMPRKVNNLLVYLLCLKYNNLVNVYGDMIKVNNDLSRSIVSHIPTITEK